MAANITDIKEWPEYATNPEGGDVFTQNINAPYDLGNICWLLTCTIICWLITPVRPSLPSPSNNPP